MHDIIQRNIRNVTISNTFDLLCEIVRTLYQRDYKNMTSDDVWMLEYKRTCHAITTSCCKCDCINVVSVTFL